MNTHQTAASRSRPKTPQRVAWHYTVGVRMDGIMREGLRPTAVLVAPPERNAVWFTLCERWEATANKCWQQADGRIVMLNTKETAAVGHGLFRIGVSIDIVSTTWRDHVLMGRIRSKIAKALEQAARRVGSNPNEWRVSYEPIPPERFERMERSPDDGKTWVPVVPNEKRVN